jgi:pimeloyl-ACP methyl ester carboxylesterase
MLDVGSGPPLLVIPGIQGRWEWMLPAIDMLSREFRVITASLPGEPGVDMPFDESMPFDAFVTYVDGLLDAAGVRDAVLCGVSYGGLIALRYAARRPRRVSALILVSTPGPGWKLNPTLTQYAQRPFLSSPLFALGAVRRYYREVCALRTSWWNRLSTSANVAWRVARAPAMPHRMSRRARLAEGQDFASDCAAITAPTLVVAGERGLDQVVPYDDTMRYASLIPGARSRLFERTGHLGTVLAPQHFAAIVSGFLHG